MPTHSSFTPLPITGIDRGGRRRYDPQAKHALIQACLEPGISLTGLALAHGINANLLRKWVVKHQRQVPRKATSRRLPHRSQMRTPAAQLMKQYS